MTATNYAYHRTIRKLIVAFGNLFNEIKLARYDEDGKEVEHFLVPIVYGGKEKYVSRLEGDPELDKKVQVTLPIMSFEMNNMTYDAGRKLNTNFKNNAASGGTSTTLSVYNPVPFDFEFSLFAYVRNIEDGAQLMEKILPYFTPDYTINVNMIPEMGVVKQIPIILKSVNNEVDYEGDYNTKVRSIIWTLNFTVKGYLYGPVTQPRIIKTSITNILNDPSLHDYNIVGTMATGGLGKYQTGESVYQGYSYLNSTSTATVVSWNSTSRLLELTNLFGHFVSSEEVIGVTSNAKWTPSKFNVSSNASVQIVVTPNPSNVILPNNYTYTVTTTEFPNIT
jgi:hypothetical protein